MTFSFTRFEALVVVVMLTSKHRHRIRAIATSEWVSEFESGRARNKRQQADQFKVIRHRITDRIVDEFPSESVIGSIVMGLAIRFAFKLIEKWLNEQSWTAKDINAYNRRS
jgi:hypothetical protein